MANPVELLGRALPISIEPGAEGVVPVEEALTRVQID
jgi:hypothetical protein